MAVAVELAPHRAGASQAAAKASPALTGLAFATAPSLFACLWFAIGVLLAQRTWTEPAAILAAICLFAPLSLTAMRASPRLALLPVACLWVMMGLLLSEIQPAPDPQTELVQTAESGGHPLVEGEIVRTGPIRTRRSHSPFSGVGREERSESIDIRVHAVGGEVMPGGLRVTLYGPADRPFPLLHCGDSARAAVAMRAPERYLDPGVWDSTAWLRQQGIGVIGSLKTSALTFTHEGRAGFLCWLHGVQEAGSQRLIDFGEGNAALSWLPPWLRIGPEDAAMLSAMILGDRTYLQRQTRVGFERTGSFHLLVVSGMHLAIFAGFIFACASLLRLPRLWSTAVTIVSSFGYALLTGFGDPVQRSFWMVTLYLLARLLFRQRNSLNAIGFAALCLLGWNPRSLLDSSFQMTLLSVVVVAGIAMPIAERTFSPYLRALRNLRLVALDPTLPSRLAQFRVTLRLVAGRLEALIGRRLAWFLVPAIPRLALRALELLLVSGLIELAMSLPMAVYFHRITALGLPVNLLVIPLLGLALPIALISFVALLISPWLAAVPAAATAALLHGIRAIVQLFGNLPAGDFRIPAPGAPAILVAILLIGFAVWAARSSRFPLLLPVAALALSAGCVFYPRPLAYRPGTLEVTAIDVGQGDSLLVVSPEGKTLLIDAGGPIGGVQSSSTNFDIGEDVVSPMLWTRNIRRLDAVALTHAHSDHMGGMASVLRNFRPYDLWVGKNPDTFAYDALLKEASQLGIRVRHFSAGDSFRFGSTRVDVLSPARDYVPGPSATNDDSLVLHMAYRNTSVLLEGDAQAPSEFRMLSEKLHSDLLKVGHHGSKTSTTPPFLAAVDPKYAIISVGRHNPYGHPKMEVLKRLQEDHVRTFCTDAVGATSFYLDGSSVVSRPLAVQ